MASRIRARRRTTPRNVIAAASPVNFTDPMKARKQLNPDDREKIAWHYYDAIGELKQAAILIGDALARIRVYPAITPDGDAASTPEESQGAVEQDVVRELGDATGSYAEVLRQLGIHLTIAGRCHLVGLAPRVMANGTRSQPYWFVVGTPAIEIKDGKTTVVRPDSGEAVRLYGEDDADRPDGQDADYWQVIIRRHPNDPRRQDSPTFGILDACQDLEISGRYFRSVARSKISMGELWYIPDDISWGNAQPDDALVLTPVGWKQMGDVAVGDEIIDPAGAPSTVRGVFPKGERACYRLTFNDGSSTVACEDHLWQVRTGQHGGRDVVIRTSEMVERDHRKQGERCYLPELAPVEFLETSPLPVDPWMLGLLLGDGCLGRLARFSNINTHIVERVRQTVAPLIVNDIGPGMWSITTERKTGPNELMAALRDLGVMGQRAWEKRVPPQYMFASIKARLEVLRGLLDSDGYVEPGTGRIEYSSVCRGLAQDVMDLVRSLGGQARIATKSARAATHRDAYRVSIRMPEGMTPVWVPEKVARVTAHTRRLGRYLVASEMVGQLPVRCIAVSAASRLYVTDDFIPTHNTDPTTDEAGDGEALDDPLNQEFYDYFTIPVTDEDSAAAVAPGVLRGPRRPEGSGIEQHRVGRAMDELMLRWQDVAQHRFAQGINLPVEMVFGLGEANHWGAGQIEESAFRQYIEPVVVVAVDALTVAFYRPMLEAREFAGDMSRQILWYDPTNLTIDKEKRQTTIAAHDAWLISDDAARRTLGYGDDDAPDEDEVQRRLAVRRGILAGDITEQMLRNTLIPGLTVPHLMPSGEIVTTPDGDHAGEPLEDPAASGPVGEAIAAAARAIDLTRIAERLAAIDRDCWTRTELLADTVVRRAIDKAGNRIRARAQKDSGIAASIKTVTPAEVAATLGREVVASLIADDVELVRDTIHAAGPRLRALFATAQRRTLALIPRLSDTARDAAQIIQAQDREDAVVWLMGELVTIALARLFDPTVPTEDLGEQDSDVLVPFGTIRIAVAMAGGANRAGADAFVAAGLFSGVAKAFGIATGYVARKLFGEVQIAVEGFQWDYGPAPRTRPFPMHELLDGVEFQTYEDDVLRNNEGWPNVAFYTPGDHAGCKCGAIPIFKDVQPV